MNDASRACKEHLKYNFFVVHYFPRQFLEENK